MPIVKKLTHPIYNVDHNESIRWTLGRLIRSEGLNSEALVAGEAFLAALPEEPSGCVIMDSRLPAVWAAGILVRQELASWRNRFRQVARS